MDAVRLGCLSLLLFFTGTTLTKGQPLEAIPVVVRNDTCEFILESQQPGEQWLLIVGSLAQDGKTRGLTLTTRATQSAPFLPVEVQRDDPDWKQKITTMARMLQQVRQVDAEIPERARPTQTPTEKLFSIFLGSGNLDRADHYTSIAARLSTQGQHCTVYTDPSALHRPVCLSSQEIARLFDKEIFPRISARYGLPLDIDKDGRFTILLSPLLSRLQDGKVGVAGFVRGSDFSTTWPAPFCNRCDMMYLNSDLPFSPFIRSVVAHEYMHAVIYSHHVHGRYLPGLDSRDEDSWLNEGLCHLVENEFGYSWDNLDYRVSAFLNAPAHYPLVVSDYYRKGLWRTPGTRGSAYLFLRWCVDRFGNDLPVRLVKSNLHGTLNLEVHTGEPFATSFREWSVALFFSGTGFSLPAIAPLRTVNPRQPLGQRALAGPFLEDVAFGQGTIEFDLAATSTRYFLVHAPGSDRARFNVTAPTDTRLQATLVKLPPRTGRLILDAKTGSRPNTLQLEIRACGTPIQLESVEWEARSPLTASPNNTSFDPREIRNHSLRQWFNTDMVFPGTSLPSKEIPMPNLTKEEREVVFRVSGRDATGHRLSAWVVVKQVG
jgi:hypothetical protein